MVEEHPPELARLQRVVGIVRGEDPAVLGIQETRLTDGSENYFLQALRGDFDYNRVLLESDRQEGEELYGTGTTMMSKVQPRQAEAIIRGRAVQMVFAGSLGDLAIASVYFSHQSEAERVPQAREVVQEVKRHPYGLIMGDFNALSPEDGITAKDFETFNPRMKQKYGNEDGTALYYGTVEAALNEGFVDIGLRFHTPAEMTGMTDVSHGTGQHLRPVRIDYVMVTPSLVKHIRDFQRINNGQTRTASDHFPWTVDLDASLFTKPSQ